MIYADWAEEPERDTMPGTCPAAPKSAALVQAGYDVVEVSLLVIDEVLTALAAEANRRQGERAK